MNRVFLLAILNVSFVVLAQDWSTRSADFRQAAMKERKKLGLTDDKARTAYPTPELKFAASAQCVVLCPGEAKTVKLEGVFHEKGIVGNSSDVVTISNEKATAKGWEGTLLAKKTASPQLLSLETITAVSGISSSVSGLSIGCSHTWKLEVEGATLTFKTTFDTCDEQIKINAEWKRGNKVVLSKPYTVRRSSDGLDLSIELSQDDAVKLGESAAQLMQSPEMQAINKKLETAIAKIGTCSSVPANQMTRCMAGPQAEIEKLNKERETLMQKTEKKMSLAAGCSTLRLDAQNGVITGEGEGCSGHPAQDRVTVKGSYTSP